MPSEEDYKIAMDNLLKKGLIKIVGYNERGDPLYQNIGWKPKLEKRIEKLEVAYDNISERANINHKLAKIHRKQIEKLEEKVDTIINDLKTQIIKFAGEE